MKLTTVKEVRTQFNPVVCFSAKLSNRRPSRGEVKATINYLRQQGVLGKHFRLYHSAYGQIRKVTSDGVDITNKCIDALMKG